MYQLQDYTSYRRLQFLKRIIGYTKMPRTRYFLLIKKMMTDQEFVFYSLLCDVAADWDTRHDTFGIFELNYKIYADIINWKEGKIRRVMKSLMQKKFVVSIGENRYSIVGFDLHVIASQKGKDFDYYTLLMKKVTELKDHNQKKLKSGKNVHLLDSNLPKNEMENVNQTVMKGNSNSKYTGDLSASKSALSVDDTNEFNLLSEDDKEFILKNVKEVENDI